MASYSRLMTTDCFAGVVQLGRLKPKGVAKTDAVTGLIRKPRQYMTIQLRQDNSDSFDFRYRGCNCGKTVKTGFLKSEQIPLNEECRTVIGDETGEPWCSSAPFLGASWTLGVTSKGTGGGFSVTRS